MLNVSVLAKILIWMTQFLTIFTRWNICIVVVKHNCKWMNVCSYNLEVPSSICIPAFCMVDLYEYNFDNKCTDSLIFTVLCPA